MARRRIIQPGQAPFNDLWRVDTQHELGNGCVLYLDASVTGGQGLYLPDLSGQGNHGVLTNGPTWVAGQSGGEWALNFDGTNDHVDRSKTLMPSAWITAVVGLRLTNTTQTGIILGHSGETPFYDSYGKNLRYDNGVLSAQNEFNNNNPLTSYTWGDTTSWHQVVGVFQTAGVLYLDGVAVATGNLNAGTGLDVYESTYQFRLGSNYSDSRCFAGQIEYAFILNRALSPDQAARLYREPRSMLWQPGRRRYFDLAAGGATVTATRRFNPGLWTPGTNPGVM
jgi:hypothetical protein